MKATIRGTIRPLRGTPGANGVYSVDLVVELDDEAVEKWSATLLWDRLTQATSPKPKKLDRGQR